MLADPDRLGAAGSRPWSPAEDRALGGGHVRAFWRVISVTPRPIDARRSHPHERSTRTAPAAPRAGSRSSTRSPSRLLAAGVPLGFNGLITIRGRTSGLPRTTPVAIIEVAGRRWVWAPWGDVHWVRNLRAAGARDDHRARPRGGGHARPSWTRPSESRSSATSWVRSRGACRSVVRFIRIVDGVDLDDPVEAAEGRPVFEPPALIRVRMRVGPAGSRSRSELAILGLLQECSATAERSRP